MSKLNQKKLVSTLQPLLLAFLSGCLLPLAFAPVSIYVFAVISPALLLLLWRNTTPRTAFIRGLSYGVGVFGVGVSWVYISIHIFGGVGVIVASLITCLFVLVLALYFAVQGYVFAYLFRNESISKYLIGFPTTWLLFEWLRSWLFTGFPWLLLGYSQVNSPLRGFVPLIGEYGVGYILLLTSAVTVYVITIKSQNPPAALRASAPFKRGLTISISMIIIILIWLSGSLLAQIHWTQPTGKPLKVALIQGNIPQELKWDSQYLQNTLDIYYLSTQANWQSDIIIWPEGAIPLPIPQANNIVTDLATVAKQHKVALITGIPVQVNASFQYYNALMVVGNGTGSYYKRRLVPFGEYVPLVQFFGNFFQFLHIPMSNTIPGPAIQANLVAANVSIGPFICYEIAYDRALLSVLPNAQILLTVSDDAWFGHSFALAQHLEIGQFRALQSGRMLLFVGNNGITAITNQTGQIVARAPAFKLAVLRGMVQPMVGSTPWTRIGNWPIILLLFIMMFIAWLVNRHYHS